MPMILSVVELRDETGELEALAFAHGEDGSLLPPGTWRIASLVQQGAGTMGVEMMPDRWREFIEKGIERQRELEVALGLKRSR